MESVATARRPKKRMHHHPAPIQSTTYKQFHKRSISTTSTKNTVLTSPSATVSSHTRTKSNTSGRPSAEGDSETGSRHYIANVGTGGTLYLRPSRLPPHAVNVYPATPPHTSQEQTFVQAWPEARQSDASGVWTPRVKSSMLDRSKGIAVPVPPLSLANHARRRRGRSRSISTVNDASHEVSVEQSSDAHYAGRSSTALKGAERSASALDVRDRLLNLKIPHYRLGSPRWSTRGTAYFHQSIYANSTDDGSSVLTPQPYDQLFPLPPGSRRPSDGYDTRRSSASHLHPSAAAYGLGSMQSRASIASTQDGTPASIFDKIEANINDPSNVRLAPGGSQIVAATVARLIVQITSARFLDYELLSDFFLAYRDFLSSTDLLDWLLERMRWALNMSNDTGRIVRVRAFVALRHWILNYFADDFVMSYDLRRRFCDSVNRLSQELSRRRDLGAGDLNIIGELKKCWRRTVVQFWPLDDAMDASATADISPGGAPEQNESTLAASTTSLPSFLQQASSSRALGKGSQLFMLDQKTNQKAKIVSIISEGSGVYVHRGSIPTSPLSEDSLQILSCSIPFLQKVRPGANAERQAQQSAPRPVLPQRQNSLSRKTPAESRHRRQGSFHDAVHEDHASLPSTDSEPTALEELPNVTLIGGLVRGLLLAPTPSAITRYSVRSPPIDPGKHHGHDGNEDYFEDTDSHHSNGVRRIVGDVKRALSIRKVGTEPSTRSHRTGSSNGSRGSNRLRDERPSKPESPESPDLSAPASMSRTDLLAARIEKSYRQHFLGLGDGPHDDNEQIAVSFPKAENARPTLPRSRSHHRSISDVARRLGSQISTSPRSIVIVDATALPGSSVHRAHGIAPGIAPDTLMPSPLFEGLADYPLPQQKINITRPPYTTRSSSGQQSSAQHRRDTSIDGQLRQSFLFPQHLEPGRFVPNGDNGRYRKSSDVHGPLPLELKSVPSPNQLRRRPGGDLKAADHVQDLVFSTVSGGDDFTAPSSPRSQAVLSDEFSLISAPTDGGEGKHDRNGSKASYNLMDRACSQPHLRPSFRAEAQMLAKVDQRSSGGGIEDALARLEGKLHKSRNSGLSWFELPVEHRGLSIVAPDDADAKGFTGADFEMVSPISSTHPAQIYHLSRTNFSEEAPLSETAHANQDDHAVFPSTDTSSDMARHVHMGSESSGSIAKFLDDDDDDDDEEEAVDPFFAPRVTDVFSTAMGVQSSFLLDDNESLSDISTDLDDEPDDSLGVRSFFFDEPADEDGHLARFRAILADPPLDTHDTKGAKQPAHPALKVSTAASKILGLPVGTTVSEDGQIPPSADSKSSQNGDDQNHLPFILAFEAEVIAEQLCIIEKDALDEVDWKDLIALNWQHTPEHIRNWAEYLKEEDPSGIDLVIARFNLTVKWVVSECVLTQAVSERARCISKYIHIAVHCLRLRNYASMYQITLALLSSDLARLQRTWAFVPIGDRRMLDRLEVLCQPSRNFQNLRLEMESASLAQGCIPFIGLYTHDLTYNALKPTMLEAVRTSATYDEGPTLINFERFQTAAIITKSLLRLLEASARYVFRPHPEALSRCLWLAALEDSEISAIGSTLE